ncbi:MAG TPA: malto-oligosyltrehalose synthase [Xanthobacteraceae bacterium]
MVGVLEHRVMPPDVPIATYRLQLSAGFGFDAAADLVPYLAALGVSHLYASPFLKARPGSAHGYDIVDHNALNPEFGGEAAFARLSQALARADLGLILDFVPNHVGIGGADNAWWLDVLEWGDGSPHAGSFDIDWDAPSSRGRLLLPILGRPYGEALEAGEIVLKFAETDGTFSAWYDPHRLPIRPDVYPHLIRAVVAAAGAQHTTAGRRLLELARAHRARTREDAAALKGALASSKEAARLIASGLEAYRPKLGPRARVRALHRLLERQHYRVAHWRVAASEINYRRFFDINDLAGLRVENPGTFAAVHGLVSRLVGEGRLHGLRIDHIDGLADPIEYCRSLQHLIREARGAAEPPFYVIVEKILGEGEPMPELAGVAGTTGYEWLNAIARLLVDARGLEALERYRRQIPGNDADFSEILLQSKRAVLEALFAGDLDMLVRLLVRIAAGHWQSRDFTHAALGQALRLYLLHFPVYRTYVGAEGASPADRATIAQAISRARACRPGLQPILDFLQAALTLDLIAPKRAGYSRTRVREFATRVQQFTGPLMAKSLEDTACYRYLRLLACNEVGGDPAAPALGIAEFHRRMTARAGASAFGMTATATHDTKRGEDARARLLALSELADEWIEQVKAWSDANGRFVDRTKGKPIPSPGHQYLLYQALLGAWPPTAPDAGFVERMQAYAVKAARESKLETSWLDPDQAYERGLTAFVGDILDPKQSAAFLESFHAFAHRVALLGALNGLAQLTIKATVPGVPDFYQGSEFWDLSLVDPDNRRPVAFGIRQAALAGLAAEQDWRALQASWEDGRIKLALTSRLLALRTAYASLFRNGDHAPVRVAGEHRDHVLAFARSRGREAVIVAVGRQFSRFTDGGREWPRGAAWRASLVSDGLGSMTDLLVPGRSFPDSEIPVVDLFATMPFAVLHAVPASCAASR